MGAARDQSNGRRLSRRRFLVVGGAGVVSAGLAARYPAVFAAAAQEPSFTLDLVRREDMALLGFEFHNLALSTEGTVPTLTRIDTEQPSLVLVRFGSQHLMEEPVWWENEEPADLPGVGEIDTMAVGESRIAFLVPQTLKSFPFTEEGLFDWWRWVMQVHPRALAPDEPIPDPLPDFGRETEPDPPEDPPKDPTVGTSPTEMQTDLLLVDWLHLSPDRFSTWLHTAKPVTHEGRTELWHTRLRPRNDDGRPDTTDRSPVIRAVSSYGSKTEDVFTVLRARDQETAPEQIVKATTRYEIDIAAGTTDDALKVVRPVTADLLLMSSIGSSVDFTGNWLPGGGFSLQKWLHRSTLGRDNYVRVETRGFLFPFGHRATLVTEDERRIASNGVAYLFQRQFIILREHVKAYPGEGDNAIQGRQLPFREIRLTTTTTPDLAEDREEIGEGASWVQIHDPVTGDLVDLQFPAIATDWEGKTVQFNAVLAFFDAQPAIDTSDGSVLSTFTGTYAAYGSLTSADDPLTRRRRIGLPGEKIAFAIPDQPGETAYPVSELYLGAYVYELDPDTQDYLDKRDLPAFYPAMLAAEVRLPAIEALSGSGASSFIGYDPTFTTTPVEKAADNNQADTFARVQGSLASLGPVIDYLNDPANGKPDATSEVSATFSSAGQDVGGVALPNLEIGALSRTFGPLSGDVDSITNLETGTFTAADFFPESAKLLGQIPLSEIIDDVSLSDGGGGPTIVTTLEYGNGNDAPPTAVVVTLDWAPRVRDIPYVDAFVPSGVNNKHATLTLHGELRTVFGGDTTSTVRGELRDFTLDLITPDNAFIGLTFNRFAFEQHNDAKPTFDPDIAKVEFKGPLSFINTLQKYLSPGSDSGANKAAGSAVVPLAGPSIDIQPDGVSLGYTLEIPTVAAGVFSLQNMSFSAGITLPFTGEPVWGRFGFASPENRFVVSVYIFWGRWILRSRSRHRRTPSR